MMFVKALCVVLSLYSAIYGESRSLENSESLEKRAAGGHPAPPAATTALAQGIAEQLERLVREVTRDQNRYHILGQTQQFAYIYIHPVEQGALHLTNQGINNALTVRKNIHLDDTNHVWPKKPDKTNFRMANVNYHKDDETNEGHSEYLLLHDNALDAMIQNMKPCPEFMIIYSTNLPCMRARYPDGTPVPGKPDRCMEMVGAAQTQLLNACPNAFFYLYTNQAVPRENCEKHERFFRWGQNYIRDNQINWLHP